MILPGKIRDEIREQRLCCIAIVRVEKCRWDIVVTCDIKLCKIY